jgi:RNA polymerase sigma-70 factor (ECF subfamily)
MGLEPQWTSQRERPHGDVEPTDAQLVADIRAGNEDAFDQLVERHQATLRRIARMYTSDAVAEEVVQETWIAVLDGLDRFEGRSALRTWIIRILMNTAAKRSERERRHIPLSSFLDRGGSSPSAVAPDRFQGPSDRFPGDWVSLPDRWDEQPEVRFLAAEGVEAARRAIAELPRAQREVVTLRDVECWSSDEVSAALGLTPGNQRVLLHRGRSKVRALLERSLLDAGVRTSVADRSAPTSHPDLEHYYEQTTDRAALDAHVGTCRACLAWLADIQDQLGHLTCAEFVERVTDLLEAAVEPRERARIDRHLALCEGCRNYLDQMRATIATIGRTADATEAGEPDGPVRAGLVAAFRLWRSGRSVRGRGSE